MKAYATDECGRDGYPPEWHATIKHQVRAEAGNRCIRCGHPYRNGENGRGEWSPCDNACRHGGPVRVRFDYDDGRWHEWNLVGPESYPANVKLAVEVQAAWRILTVHHLDGDKANCRWWNLASLCQRCHLTIQGKVQMARVWPWEHSDWFKPYVAGFYAFTYLGEDLARPEVEARLDELLALELAA